LIKSHPSEKTYKLLDKILPKLDPIYSDTSITESKIMNKKIKKYILFPDITENEIIETEGLSYFRTNLREPIIQFIPKELQHLRQYFHSRTFSEKDKQYTYAFIPSYIPNLNHVTLYNAYASNIEEEMSVDKSFDNFNTFQMTGKKIRHKLSPNVDSLNRFQKQHADLIPEIENPNIQEKIRMCFEFCYWNLPDMTIHGEIASIFPEKGFGYIDPQKKGFRDIWFKIFPGMEFLSKGDYVDFNLKIHDNKKIEAIDIQKIKNVKKRNKFSVIHNLIYDRPSSIVDIVAPRKTIAKIENISEIEEKIVLISETPTVSVRQAKVTFLTNTGNEFQTKTKIMFVTKNVLDGLNNGDLINCIFAKSISIKRLNEKFSQFVIIGRVGPKIIFDIKHFVALTAWKKLQTISDNKFLCNIGSFPEFKKNVIRLISQINFDMLKFINSEKNLNDNINSAIRNLFPLFIVKDDIIYHNPPALISHIAHFYPDALEDEELMVDIAMLFDAFLLNQKDWGPSAKIKLRTHEYFEKMQLEQSGVIDLNHFIMCIPSIVNRVVYSRLFSQHWKQWFSD